MSTGVQICTVHTVPWRNQHISQLEAMKILKFCVDADAELPSPGPMGVTQEEQMPHRWTSASDRCGRKGAQMAQGMQTLGSAWAVMGVQHALSSRATPAPYLKAQCFPPQIMLCLIFDELNTWMNGLICYLRKNMHSTKETGSERVFKKTNAGDKGLRKA